jgi:hypothetical protein
MPCKTPIAADRLGISEGRLHYLIRSRKIQPPPKDTSGDYCWQDSHIEAARAVLGVDRRRKAVAHA